MHTPTGPAMQAIRLTKTFRSRAAVADLSFSVRRGRITGLLGPNGSGKTTTLRMALGLTRPTSGSVRVLGRPYDEIAEPARHVGAVLDITGIHPARTARDHLRIAQLTAGVSPERVDEVLLAVDLSDAAGQKARTYSLGMRQRLALATALLGSPELLVLDEPANGLDPTGIRWLRDALRSYADSGATVVIASHVLAEMEQTVDDVVVIHGGRLVAAGDLQDVTLGAPLEDAYLGLLRSFEEARRAR
ncbi:ABC transporter ATP-binding protein [Cellulomonas sp. Y8]|uniref:ABC transporter ATP-binding protein n=1 Tax=Cellulomonas sp. Y8 TaxID=2591145 RepID=UPI003D757967